MRLPPNRINGKWVAASKPQALGMVANTRIRLNTYFARMTVRAGQFESIKSSYMQKYTINSSLSVILFDKRAAILL
jgi:hypothetical protein